MTSLKARALALATKEVAPPTYGELLMRRCEALVDVIHDAKGLQELSDAWTDAAGFLNSRCAVDLELIRRARRGDV